MCKFSHYISSDVGKMQLFFELQQSCTVFQITSLQLWQRCKYFQCTTNRCNFHDYWDVILITSKLFQLSQLIDAEEMQRRCSEVHLVVVHHQEMQSPSLEMQQRCTGDVNLCSVKIKDPHTYFQILLLPNTGRQLNQYRDEKFPRSNKSRHSNKCRHEISFKY